MMHSETRSVLASHGLRYSEQRERLYDALRATKEHPTAEELHVMVGGASSGVSLATVYNVLDRFCDAGLCRRLPTTSGPGRFDAHTESHVHVVMPDGRLVDVPDELSRPLLESVSHEAIERVAAGMGLGACSVSIQVVARPPVSPR